MRFLTIMMVCLMLAGSAFAVDLEQHKTNYIMGYATDLAGTDIGSGQGLIEYQVGLAAPLADLTSLNIPIRLMGAFTDFALWDVNAPSAPFKEHNYEPEAWFEWLRDDLFNGTSIGFRHVSTGEDSLESAGWNRVFITKEMSVDAGGYTFSARPELWFVTSEDLNTGGIGDADHTGLWVDHWGGTITLAVSRPDASFELELGRTSGRLSVDFDVIPGLNQYTMYIQAFRGQMESLLSYDQYRTGVGIGLALKR